MPYTTARTGGETLVDTSPSGYFKTKVLRERVAVTSNALGLSLTQTLPPGAEIIWTSLKYSAAITLFSRAQTTNTSQDATMNVALVWTARTSLTTNVTTLNAALGKAQTSAGAANAANDVAIGKPPNVGTAAGVNTSTSYQSLYLVPYAATTAAGGAARYNTGTDTTSYHFGSTTGYIDVLVYYNEYTTTPNF